MTNTTGANAAKINQPPALAPGNAGDMRAEALVTLYFRQSSDGSNFTITPVYLHPADAAQALQKSAYEYSKDGVTFAAWPNSYANSTQAVGGRGRLLGATGVAF